MTKPKGDDEKRGLLGQKKNIQNNYLIFPTTTNRPLLFGLSRFMVVL